MRQFSLIIILLSVVYAHVVTPAMFQEMNKRLKENPTDVEALTIRSHYYENEKMYSEAIHDVEKVIKILDIDNPELQPAIFIRLAQLYINDNKYQDAITTFNILLTAEFCRKYGSSPPIQHAILWRAKMYAELEEYGKALVDAEFVLERNQKMPVYFVEAAKIAEKKGDIAKAFELYQNAAINFPTPESEPFVARAINLVCKENSQQAMELLQKLSAALPQEPYPYFYQAILAKNYLHNEDLYAEKKEKVLELAKEMSEIDPCASYFWRAKMQFFAQNYVEALLLLDQAIEKDARPTVLYSLKNKIYQLQKNEAKAQENAKLFKEMSERFSYQWLYWCEIGG